MCIKRRKRYNFNSKIGLTSASPPVRRQISVLNIESYVIEQMMRYENQSFAEFAQLTDRRVKRSVELITSLFLCVCRRRRTDDQVKPVDGQTNRRTQSVEVVAVRRHNLPEPTCYGLIT